MFHLLALCVLNLSVFASTDSQAAASSPPPTCNINNNFYAGPSKKVETLLTDMKKQLDELQRQVELMAKRPSTRGRERLEHLEHNVKLLMKIIKSFWNRKNKQIAKRD